MELRNISNWHMPFFVNEVEGDYLATNKEALSSIVGNSVTTGGLTSDDVTFANNIDVDAWSIVRMGVTVTVTALTLSVNGFLLAAVRARRHWQTSGQCRLQNDATGTAIVEIRTGGIIVPRISGKSTLRDDDDDQQAPVEASVVAVYLQSTAATGLTSGVLAALTCAVIVLERVSPMIDSKLFSSWRDATESVLDGLAAGVSTLYLYGHIVALIDRHLALSLRPTARYRRLVNGSGRARLVVIFVWIYSAIISAIVCIPGRSGKYATTAKDQNMGLWSTLPAIAERRLPIASFAIGFAVSCTVAFSVIYQTCQKRRVSREWPAATIDNGQPPKVKWNRFETSVIVSYVLCIVSWSADVCLRIVGWVGVTYGGVMTEVVQQVALLCGLTAGALAPSVYLTVGGACRWFTSP